MRKLLLLMIPALMVLGVGCVGVQGHHTTPVFDSTTPVSVQLGSVFDEYNGYQGSVCVGISGPYTSKSKAVSVATENCLQMLSYYVGIAMQAEYGHVVRTVKGIDHLDTTIFGGTSDEIYRQTAERMEIVDIRWYGGKIGAAVFATVPGMARIKWEETSDWMKRTPEVPGFHAVVASSNRSYADMVKAIEAATFRAAQAMLDTVASNINVTYDIQSVHHDQYMRDLYSISGVRMDGFVVLRYGYDEQSGSVCALAVTKKRD